MQIGGTHPRRGASGRTAPSTIVDQTRWSVGAALLLTAALTLGACANGTPTATPPPTPTSTTLATTSATTTTTSPTTTPTSPSPTTNTLAERFPETAAGAEAFVSYLFTQVNAAYSGADHTLLSDIVVPRTCPDCRRWATQIGEMESKNQHLVGDFMRLVEVTALLPKGGRSGVITLVDSPRARIVDAAGHTVRTVSEQPRVQVNLELRFEGHWRLTKTEVVQ